MSPCHTPPWRLIDLELEKGLEETQELRREKRRQRAQARRSVKEAERKRKGKVMRNLIVTVVVLLTMAGAAFGAYCPGYCELECTPTMPPGNLGCTNFLSVCNEVPCDGETCPALEAIEGMTPDEFAAMEARATAERQSEDDVRMVYPDGTVLYSTVEERVSEHEPEAVETVQSDR